MGILDIFKKVFQENSEKLRESISLESLKNRLEEEKQKNNEERERIKKEMIQELEKFEEQIKKEIEELGKISLESRKEQEKIKLVVNENLKLYLGYVSRFLELSKNLRNLESESYFIKINEGIYNFNKIATSAYEKATILVGELERCKNLFNILSRNINSIFNSNQETIQKMKIIENLRQLTQEHENLNNSIKFLDGEIENQEKRLRENTRKIQEKEKEIDDFKKSDDFKNDAELKEKINEDRKKLDEDIIKIKEVINLKELAKKFHESEKSRNLIAGYQENFKQALKDDENLEFEKLSGVELGNIREKLAEKQSETDVDIKLKNYNEDLEKLRLEEERINKENILIKERKSKLQDKIDEIKSRIKEMALNMDLEVR